MYDDVSSPECRANSCPDNVAQLKYYQNLIHEEIKRRLNSGNSCYHSVQCSRLLSKNIKMRIYKTIILPVVLYGCETLSFTLKKEHRMRALKGIFESKRDEVAGVERTA
jgi:hypothetical protein